MLKFNAMIPKFKSTWGSRMRRQDVLKAKSGMTLKGALDAIERLRLTEKDTPENVVEYLPH
jgi:hypothetical protein